jgi:nucleotide-binding universal stress UspA family protein
MKILIAVDGSSYSDDAVESVATRPWPEGTEVDVLAVFEPTALPAAESWALPEKYYVELDKLGEEKASTAAAAAATSLGSGVSKFAITTTIAQGHAAATILERAEQWAADLIVVGSHGYKGITRFLLGSVSQAVASHAPCSVEIVRKRRVKVEA